MDAKELKRLRRSDLLEMLLDLRRENEQLSVQLEKARLALQSRTVTIEEAGSLAEAAIRLNGVFQAAQEACDQYTQNVQRHCREQVEACKRLERLTRDKCDQMLIEATQRAEKILSPQNLK